MKQVSSTSEKLLAASRYNIFRTVGKTFILAAFGLLLLTAADVRGQSGGASQTNKSSVKTIKSDNQSEYWRQVSEDSVKTQGRPQIVPEKYLYTQSIKRRSTSALPKLRSNSAMRL